MTSLAYVIYTSGSTGKPKGAMVEHIGMMNHIWAKIHDLQLTTQSIVAQNASHTFDISVWQFFAALVPGGKTAVYPHQLIMEPEHFISRLTRDRVTVLEVVPSYLAIILDTLAARETLPLSMDYLLVTGEEVKPHLVKRWFEHYPHIKMVNAYGPTEASDDITHHIMDKAPKREPIPIGKPLGNFNIYILDENMNLCPVGVKGEICVSGIGVGRGYLNNPELTAQKFQIPNKAGNYKSHTLYRSYILYHTGDLGCWLPDGTINFFGRKDYQVKIRGFRIELGEIERRLLNHEEIKEAVVVDRENPQGNKYLCAYLVAAGRKLDISKIKTSLAQQLPDYMVPSYFVEMETLPLTANGKIDRKALPKTKMGSQSFIPYITGEMLNRLAVPGGKGKAKRTGIHSVPQAENPVDPLTKKEKEKILFSFNDTQTPYSSGKTLRELIEEKVQKWPHRTILVFEDRQITYAHLHLTAERLARRLKHKGIKQDSIVGLMVERSIEWIAAILGILKAGGAYLPIGSEFPPQRRKWMAADTQTKIILVNRMKNNENQWESVFAAELLDINTGDEAKDQSKQEIHLEPVPDRSRDLVYVMYTSGTTGTPKGVMIENRSLVNLIKGLTHIIDFNESHTILSLSTVSFDIVVEETLLTLTRGTKIVIGNTYQQSVPSAAGLVMQKEAVTILKVTPSMMWLYVSDREASKGLKGLKHLMLGGEALPQALLEKMRKHTNAKIYNTYGPTETTAVSTVKDVTCQPLDIGKPIANTRIYILGPGDTLQPVGVVGEICIGGHGVARGYLNNPELTAKKFCLRRPGGRFLKKLPPWTPRKNFLLEGTGGLAPLVYHTGDLAKWLPDGNIEFIGRKDHQVQIRGLRIEPREIESELLTYEHIKEAVVVVKEDDNEEKYLSAGIVSPKRIIEADLRKYLSKKLPHYMIPLSFFQLEEIPLLPTKKANRTLLQAIDIEKQPGYEAPGDDIEKRLAEIWAEVLGIDKNLINRDADFFRLGGDSILGLQMVLKAREAGINITSLQVFKHPILEKLASRVKTGKQQEIRAVPGHGPLLQIDEKEREELIANHPGIRDIYPLTAIQQQTLSYNLLTTETSTTVHQLSWIMTGDLEIPAFQKAWQTVAQRHCILRTTFKRRKLKDPFQLVYPAVNIPFQQLDCSGMTDLEQKQRVEDYLINDKKQRFKMAQAPLMRLCLIILNNHSYRFICSYSSLLFDNWSSTIIVKEVFHFYDFYINHKENPALLKKPRPFGDYVKWLNSTDHSAAKHFWTSELEGFDSPVDLGSHRFPGNSINTDFKPAERNFRLPHRETTHLLSLAKKFRLTLATLLQGAWVITLSHFSAEEDILSGVLSYGRPADVTGIESMVGLFINTIPVRVKVSPHQDLITWLREFQDKQVGLRQFDYISMEDISKWSAVPQHKIQKAIYERTFVLVKSPGEEFFSRLSRNNSIKISQFDDSLILNVPLRVYAELSQQVIIRLKYNSACFLPGGINDMAHYWEILLKHMVNTPGLLLGDLKTKMQIYTRRN
jgi:amino acid adenylation domain-containing protein